jgi:type II restriction enzyme
VVSEIAASTFGSAYRGSSLEVIVGSVAEQRQIFRGADHAFLWKPKLRIPDIYENQENQRAFGRFLDVCLCCATETEIVAAIHELASKAIKGLGPAAANLLYFLHPTHALPFNTAIGKGYNALTGANVKLLIEVRSHKPRMQPEKALARMRELSVDSGCLAALESLVADGMRVDPL